jgi:hypothetical protein
MAADPLVHLQAVAAAAALPDQPRALFAALETATAAAIGHRLFTIMRYHADTAESERIWSNQPEAYPVRGRKPVVDSAWTRRIFAERAAYIGRDAADIRSVFPDHELIASLGCASVLNLPVVWAGRVLGTLNLLHEAGWYTEHHAALGVALAGLGIPALLPAAP